MAPRSSSGSSQRAGMTSSPLAAPSRLPASAPAVGALCVWLVDGEGKRVAANYINVHVDAPTARVEAASKRQIALRFAPSDFSAWQWAGAGPPTGRRARHKAHAQGHGYVEAEVDRANPFFLAGSRLRGHEFHYSRVVEGGDSGSTTLRVDRGRGIGEGRDGLVKGRVWASYLHLHALGTPTWATSLVGLAREYRAERPERAKRVEGAAERTDCADDANGPSTGSGPTGSGRSTLDAPIA